MNQPDGPPDPILCLREVSKAFRVDGRLVWALEGISVEARRREFVSLIGPSGCGKSTLLNIVCGLMEADGGEIVLQGTMGRPRLGQVAYMPQRDLLLPWRRLVDNLILGAEVQGRDLGQARAEAQALLPLFGLEGFEDAYPATLSGGMRQRAALMRTFLCRQDPMLLDEPFGALDALTRRTLRGWLLRVWEQLGHTVLFVTHDVEEALYLSDRVYVLSPRPGRVVCDLRVELARPRGEHTLQDPIFSAYRDKLLQCLGV